MQYPLSQSMPDHEEKKLNRSIDFRCFIMAKKMAQEIDADGLAKCILRTAANEWSVVSRSMHACISATCPKNTRYLGQGKVLAFKVTSCPKRPLSH